MLLSLNYPPVTNVYLGLLMQVVTFQVWDFTNFYNYVLKLDNDGNDPLTY